MTDKIEGMTSAEKLVRKHTVLRTDKAHASGVIDAVEAAHEAGRLAGIEEAAAEADESCCDADLNCLCDECDAGTRIRALTKKRGE